MLTGQKIVSYLRTYRHLFLTLLIFGMLYAIISLVNHYLFRTYALDLGLYTNALYKYSRFIMADSLMIKENYEVLLGSHFDLYLVLLSPLVYLFGTYTLLIVQIISILLGGVGVFKYFKDRENTDLRIAYLAMIYFFLFFGIFSAVSYDYHSVVVATCIVPWFFYYFRKEAYKIATLLVILILISQENLALILLFLFIGLMFEYRKNKKALFILSAYTLLSMTYFIVITQLIIPAFSEGETYRGFVYSTLGDTPIEAVKNLILNPVQSIKTLFINHTNHPYGDYVKLETHLILLLTGVYMLFFKPWYLFMLIPIYAQKLFHDTSTIWSISSQYSIEFAPILAIGVFSVITDIKRRTFQNILIILALIGATASTVRVMDNTVQFTDKSAIRFYKADHYNRPYNVKEVHAALKTIPAQARVSAQTNYTPHLSLRKSIYQFPLIKDAEYIVFSTLEGSYPMHEDKFAHTTNQLLHSDEWQIQYQNDHFFILKKVQ